MSELLNRCGIPCAGETTRGNAIARRFGYRHVDVVEVKVDLFGPVASDDDLTHAEWTRIYQATHEHCQECAIRQNWS
jgi:hypothetical protein